MKKVLKFDPSPRTAVALALVASVATMVAAQPLASVAKRAANAITGKQIKNNSITGKDVKNRTLREKDFKKSAIASLKSQIATNGVAGLQGEQGPRGEQGPPGLSDLTFKAVAADQSDESDSGHLFLVAPCGSGKKAISGGYTIDAVDKADLNELEVVTDASINEGHVVALQRTSDFDIGDYDLTVYATCARVS